MVTRTAIQDEPKEVRPASNPRGTRPVFHSKPTAKVLHSVRGRIRFSIPGITGTKADDLAQRLGRKRGIHGVRTRRATSNFVLCFDHRETDQERVLRAAETIAARLLYVGGSLPKEPLYLRSTAPNAHRDTADSAELRRRRRQVRRMIVRYGPEVAIAILGIGLSAVEGPLGLAFAGLTEVGRITRIVRRAAR